MITKEKELTGYPSIDKPWLKYYSEKAINAPLPECTLYEYIYENNKDYLNQNALNYFGKKITYSELFANIEKAAKSFQSMGVKKGDIVTIMSMHTPETIYCIYALNRLGAVANMVYMTLSEKELLHEVKNTESKILVILNLAYEKVEKIRTELDVQSVVVISPADSMKFLMKTAYKLKTKSPKLQVGYLSYQDFISLGKPVSKVADAPYEKMAPAIIAHTSGTTGEPKGVMLSNYNLNAVAYQYSVSGMNLKKGEKFFNMLPPFIGFGVSVGMNVPLVLGLEEILWILPDKEKVAEGFVKTKPNHFVSGPAYLDDIMSYTDVDMSGLKNFGGGGESITIEKEKIVNEFLKTHGANVRYLTGYGMTEFGATVCTGMNHAYKSGTLGIPFPAVIIKIVDSETGNEMSYNQVGEMCFNSPNTMIGYYKNEKATKDIIRVHKDGKEWLHTGDLGMVDEEGFVHFKGRLKRISYTRDKDGIVNRIFPMRIEELLSTHQNVRSCGTIVIPDEERINILVSFVSLRNKDMSIKELPKELMEYAKAELPEHHVPAKIIILDEMPLTQSGKIDYKTLEKMV